MWNPFARKKEEPQIPPFPKTLEQAEAIFFAYARDERPMDFLFEFYVMDVIGELPAETRAALDQLGTEVVNTPDWRSMVREDLHLSETFDIAALDLWYRNSDSLREQGESYHPWEFAIELADQYFADDSHVDVWPEGALEQAKERIAARR